MVFLEQTPKLTHRPPTLSKRGRGSSPPLPRQIRLIFKRFTIEPVIASAAKQSIAQQVRKLDCFAARAMTISRHAFNSRGAVRPRFAFISRPEEGVGNAGCQRTRSRACSVDSTRVSHHGCAETPGIPARGWF